MCTMLGNTSFIGYPMIQALLGHEALPYAVVYDQFGTFVMLSTVGLVVLARYGGEHPPGVREIALRIVRFPPVWALVFGLTLMPEQPPAWIATALGQLASVMLMLVMLAVGMTIQLRLPRDEVGPLALGLSLKLVLLPALARVGAGLWAAGRHAPGGGAGVGDADHGHRRGAGDLARAGAAAGGGPGGLRDRAGDGHAAGLAVRADRLGS